MSSNPVSSPAPARARTRPPKPAWREWLENGLLAVFFTQFVGTSVGVAGASMMPTLRDGERLVVPKYEPWLHKVGVGEFQRGDIVVFKPPVGRTHMASALGLREYRPFLVKRLVAVPGDRVRVTEGRVYVNDQEIPQNFTTDYWQQQGCWDTTSALANNALSGPWFSEQPEITIPAGQYFVMGDNRHANGSEDSRHFGPVALRDIAGRAVASVWPVMRAEQMDYDCNSLNPQLDTTTSGESVLNWRVLGRTAAYEQFNASPGGQRR